MHFAILFLSFLSISSALPLVPRDAPELLSSIKDLNTKVGELTTAVNNFDGSLLGFLPQALSVIVTEAKVDKAIQKATDVASDSSPFTAAESQEVVQTLASLIDPVQKSLDAIKTKYPQFKKTLTAPIVLKDLKTLKSRTGDLITAVTPKVTPENAGLLGLGSNILNQAYDSAIAVYSA